MRATVRLLSEAAHARKPSINFLGRRKWPSTPEEPHPHSQAPENIKSAFSDFLSKSRGHSSSSTSTSSLPSAKGKGSNSGKQVVADFWEAPARFWQPRVRTIEENEIEAIMSGGASLR